MELIAKKTKKERKWNKEMQDKQETGGKMVDLNLHQSVITLKVN